jgi:hypothetical protein
MLDCIIDSHIPIVDGTVNEVDNLEDLIYELSGNEHADLLKVCVLPSLSLPSPILIDNITYRSLTIRDRYE